MNTLRTTEQTLAAILAVAAIAENDFNQTEQTTISQIGEALGCPTLVSNVNIAISQVRQFDRKALANYLTDATNKVEKGEEAYILEAVLQVILSDKVLAYTEASNLLTIADLLHVRHEVVLLMMADIVKENNDINIKFEV